MPKLLLLDFDGVLRLWPASDHALEIEAGLPAGAIRAAAFSPALLQPAITGNVTDEQWRKQIKDRLRADYPEVAVEQTIDRWSSSHTGQIDQRVASLVSALRSQLRVVLATNATTRLGADLQTLGVNSLFDDIANSSTIGYCKPQAEFFNTALLQQAVPPHEALFVDDSATNVVAARKCGLVAHHYRSFEEMQTFLEEALEG